MGGMVLLLLNSLLLALLHLNSPLFTLLLFNSVLCTLRPLLPHISHFLLPHLHLRLQGPFLRLLLLPSSLHLQHSTLALSASRDHVLSGSQSNGQSHSATSRSGSPLQPFHLLMKRMTTQMIPLTSSMRTQPLSLSPHLTNSHSNALRHSYGTQHVRRRWKLTESMAPGMLSNCPLGSVQLGPDGS
jgi:hypothetical protein